MVSASVKSSHCAVGSFGSGGDGVVLAGPAWGERAGADDSDVFGRKRGSNLAGAVGGVIVDHDDFKRNGVIL